MREILIKIKPKEKDDLQEKIEERYIVTDVELLDNEGNEIWILKRR